MFLAVNGVSVLLVADDAEFTARRAKLARLVPQAPTADRLRLKGNGGGRRPHGLRRDFAELYRRAASRVAEFLPGTSPRGTAGRASNKVKLVLEHLKTAKALGIEVPRTLLARADEVIE